uniref:Uncharacterized protein n=1 Tax=Cacopsylla melanoneura TaxID=428564 RepID=A0A8D8UHL9_9HEMI
METHIFLFHIQILRQILHTIAPSNDLILGSLYLRLNSPFTIYLINTNMTCKHCHVLLYSKFIVTYLLLALSGWYFITAEVFSIAGFTHYGKIHIDVANFTQLTRKSCPLLASHITARFILMLLTSHSLQESLVHCWLHTLLQDSY